MAGSRKFAANYCTFIHRDLRSAFRLHRLAEIGGPEQVPFTFRGRHKGNLVRWWCKVDFSWQVQVQEIGGAALCEPRSADFVAGVALSALRCSLSLSPTAHTLIEMRTDLTAVPHASLSKNRLRCQVQTPPNDFPQSDENPANLQVQTSSSKKECMSAERKTDAMASDLF